MKKIAEDMDGFRETQMSVRRTTNEYLMLCLIGFGSIDRRDALMRVISWALEPLLLYSAFIKDLSTQEFETIMITKKQVSATAVEEWLSLFNMGLCCIQFDSYMQRDMVTCISRIHHMGKHWFGSFKAKTSARVRRDFYKEHMKEMKAKEERRLVEITGLTLTTRNMLHLFDRVGTLQVQVQRLESQIAERRDALPENASAESRSEVEQAARTVAIVSRFAENAARMNLASAYRRLQANGNLPASAQVRPTGPAGPQAEPMQEEVPPPPPDTVDLTSTPDTPPRGIPFFARPAPTGHVTVYVMRE